MRLPHLQLLQTYNNHILDKSIDCFGIQTHHHSCYINSNSLKLLFANHINYIIKYGIIIMFYIITFREFIVNSKKMFFVNNCRNKNI